MIKTLYKKNGKKVQKWTIEAEDGKHRTTEGFVGGSMTTTQWTQCSPKNVGRKNATTAHQQALLELAAKVKLKRDKGYVDDESGELSEEATRFEPMLAHSYGDHLKKVAPYLQADNVCMLGQEPEVFSQPKLDGMRCNAEADWIHPYAINVKLSSRTGKPINSVPHIANALEAFLMKHQVIIDGELYNHDLKDDFNTLISYVKKAKPSKDELEACAKVIEYHVYDVFFPNHPDVSFKERHEWIMKYMSGLHHVKIVRTDGIVTQAQMDEYYALYREQGYEGQMIRLDAPYVQARTPMLLKRKEFQDAEYEIVDIEEGVGNRSGGMGKFILKVGEETFESNGLGNMEYYKHLLENKKDYIGKKATVRFQNLTPRGVPRFPCVVTIRDYE